jgi:MFS family permease
MIFRLPKTKKLEGVVTSSGIGEPSIYHALVVIFLEFFAWGLLTSPMITVLNQTFPEQTFLMNGLIVGIKGILSFLSAPLVGALSDIWGRKFFLLITVFFTCAPIPLMKINTWWYFAMISISGVFAVTFSVVFAYVADVTDESDRSAAYGLVSATFAASLVMSPALGAYLEQVVIFYDYSHCYCFKLLIIKRQKVISIFKLFQTFTWCHRVNNVAMLKCASN